MAILAKPLEAASDGVRPLAWRVKDGARQLGVCEATIYNLAKRGKLKLIRVAGRGSHGGGRTLIPDTELRRIASEGA
jgi:hypothetical protein